MDHEADSPEVLERFHAHLELVERLGRSVGASIGAGIDREDLLAAGREGLLDAARRFEPERGVPFGAYATLRIRGSMIDGVRRFSALPRRAFERLRALEAAHDASEGAAEDVFGARPPGAGAPEAEAALDDQLGAVATAMAMALASRSVEDPEDDERQVSPEDALVLREMAEQVRAAAAELPEPEGEIVRRYYFGGEQLDHVATDLGLSKSWASRLHSRAVKRLTRRLRDHAR